MPTSMVIQLSSKSALIRKVNAMEIVLDYWFGRVYVCVTDEEQEKLINEFLNTLDIEELTEKELEHLKKAETSNVFDFEDLLNTNSCFESFVKSKYEEDAEELGKKAGRL